MNVFFIPKIFTHNLISTKLSLSLTEAKHKLKIGTINFMIRSSLKNFFMTHVENGYYLKKCKVEKINFKINYLNINFHFRSQSC